MENNTINEIIMCGIKNTPKIFIALKYFPFTRKSTTVNNTINIKMYCIKLVIESLTLFDLYKPNKLPTPMKNKITQIIEYDLFNMGVNSFLDIMLLITIRQNAIKYNKSAVVTLTVTGNEGRAYDKEANTKRVQMIILISVHLLC